MEEEKSGRNRKDKRRSRNGSEESNNDHRRVKKRKSSSKKKTAKKEKKSKKSKRKHKGSGSDGDTGDDIKKGEYDPIEKVVEKKTSALNFFAQLKDSESKKGTIGTLHATGRDKLRAEQEKNQATDDWECIKPGCGKSNFKKLTQCEKCGAMRRITMYR